jgi:hypothetical protein
MLVARDNLGEELHYETTYAAADPGGHGALYRLHEQRDRAFGHGTFGHGTPGYAGPGIQTGGQQLSAGIHTAHGR